MKKLLMLAVIAVVVIASVAYASHTGVYLPR